MASPLTCDTSIVIASLSQWHPRHSDARATLPTIDWLPAHVLAESVSVLSRLPNGFAMPMVDAVNLVRRLAGGHARQLRAERYLSVLAALGAAGLGGGAVYDAIIAATAREHDATLLTLDGKAQRTYSAVGVRFELLA